MRLWLWRINPDLSGPGAAAPRLIEGFIATALPAEARTEAEPSPQAILDAMQQRLAAGDSQQSSDAPQTQSPAAAAEGTGTWSVKPHLICTMNSARRRRLMVQLSMSACDDSCQLPHCHASFLVALPGAQLFLNMLYCRCTLEAHQLPWQ